MSAPRRLLAPFSELSGLRFWTVVIGAIAAIKLVFLLVDPLPMFFMGDSGSYLETAVSGWIPRDRSFLYGFFIRLVTHSASLSPLIIAQVIASAISAIVVVYICFSVVQLPAAASACAGLLMAVDPLQLLYERLVLTEAISLTIFVLIICFSAIYVRRPSIGPLVVIPVLSILLIGFRLSFLPVVTISAAVLCFIPPVVRLMSRAHQTGNSFHSWRSAALHAVVSLSLTLALQDGYKRWNGALIGRPPAFQYSDGVFLAAAWAPILRADAAPTPEVAAVIGQGADYHLRDLAARDLQHFGDGFLVSRLRAAGVRDVNGVCKQLAVSSAIRDPIGLARIGLLTLGSYWDFGQLARRLATDRGDGRPLSAKMIEMLATRFHLASGDLHQLRTVTKAYQDKLRFFYPFLLLTPLAALAAAVWLRERRVYALLLLVHSSVLVATIALFSPAPIVRYLQPLSPLLAITLALLASGSARATGPSRSSNEKHSALSRS